MANKNLIIINNEKISKEKNGFCCDNIDIKSISEDLNEKFEVSLIARSSKSKRSHNINLDKIKISFSIFLFLINIFKTLKKKDVIYLIISITPYTFFSYLLLFFFRKKVFVYLRSNGYEEYKAIFGFLGSLIYYLMFKIVTFRSSVISCQESLFNKDKSNMVFPSELNSLWLENTHKPLLDKPRLLYVGRIKVEKGIFSLLGIFKKININANLSIVGKLENKNLNHEKINYIKYVSDSSSLIKIYDDHNIFILPSFTEAHPKVIDESLARLRPVIIFEEIKHIVKDKKGIFVSKRDAKSLSSTIDFVMKDYISIQESMGENKLPTKKEFISEMVNILGSK